MAQFVYIKPQQYLYGCECVTCLRRGEGKNLINLYVDVTCGICGAILCPSLISHERNCNNRQKRKPGDTTWVTQVRRDYLTARKR